MKRRTIQKTLLLGSLICFMQFFFVFPTFAAVSSVYTGTQIFGGSGTEGATTIAYDSNGNKYITGSFSGTVDFDPSSATANQTSNGNQDFYLTKINENGSYAWTRTFGGSDSDEATGIVVDSSSNIYLTGRFSTTVDFDPSGATTNRTSNGSQDIYILKLTSDGLFVWVQTVGGTGSETANGIAIDTSGNVLSTGSFAGTVDFDPSGGTDNHTSVGSSDAYVWKLSSSGTFVLARNIGATTSSNGYSISTDSSNNIYVTGIFQGTVDLDPSGGTDSHVAPGVNEIQAFILKLTSAGNFSFGKSVGGTSTDWGYIIRTDTDDNVYLAGYYQGTVNFHTSGGTDNHTSNGSTDAYILKFAGADGSFIWANTFGSTSFDSVLGLTTDLDANVYTTGYFSGTVDFDPSGGTDNNTSNGNTDIFVTRMNADGSYGWTKTFGGTASDRGTSAAIYDDSLLSISGFFLGTVNFNQGGTAHSLTSAGSQDVFISEFGGDPYVAPTPSPNNSSISSASSDGGTSNCSDLTPSEIPNLFQIDTAGTYANVYFTKTEKNTTGYDINYGYNEQAKFHSDIFPFSGNEWVIGRTIFRLKPSVTYYFRVRAINGCSAGEWSKVMKVTTKKDPKAIIPTFYSNLIPSQALITSTPQPVGN